eukprot:PhF_6_TR8327/c0_g1_i1/m.12994
MQTLGSLRPNAQGTLTLTQKRQRRHDDSLLEFDEKVQRIGVEFLNSCNETLEVRQHLFSLYTTMDQTMEQRKAKSNTFDKDHWTTVGVNRSQRIVEVKNDLMALLAEIVQSHKTRCEIIIKLREDLIRLEELRKQKLRTALSDLIHQLCTIAHVDVQENHKIVREIGNKMNQEVSDNAAALQEMYLRLTHNECLRQNSYLQTYDHIYKATIDAVVKGCIQWTVQYLGSDVFRRPPGRMQLLYDLHSEHRAVQQQANHCLRGLETLCRSLGVQDPIGGTAKRAWLELVSLDDNELSPFVPRPNVMSPERLVEEWRESSISIIRSVQLIHTKFSHRAKKEETTLRNVAFEEARALQHDIALTYSVMREAIPFGAQSPCFPGMQEGDTAVFVLDTPVQAVEEVILNASKQMGALQAEIDAEGHCFVELLCGKCEASERSLECVFLTYTNSAIPVFKGASLVLTDITTAALSTLRSCFKKFMEYGYDFEDSHRLREEELSRIINNIHMCGTPDVATDLFTKALKLLQTIESKYVVAFKERVDMLDNLSPALNAVMDKKKAELLKYVCLTNEPPVNPASPPPMSTSPVPPADVGGKGPKKPPQKAASKGPGGKPVEEVVEPAPKQKVVATITVKSKAGVVYTSTQEDMIFGTLDPLAQPPVDKSAASALNTSISEAANVGGAQQPPGAPPGAAGVPPGVVSPTPPVPAEKDAQLIKTFEDVLAPFFDADTLASSKLASEIQSLLRVGVIDWLDEFILYCNSRAVTYVDDKRTILEIWRSEKLRLHQRRAPSLEAEVYEARMRELKASVQERAKTINYIEERFEAAVNNAKTLLASHISDFEKILKHITKSREGLSKSTTISALDVQNRALNSQLTKLLESLEDSINTTIAALDGAQALVTKETTQLLHDKSTSSEQAGRPLGPAEVKLAEEAVANLRSRTNSALEQTKNALNAQKQTFAKQVAAEEGFVKTEVDANVRDLTFLRKVQEILAEIRGRISNTISQATDNERKLETIVSSLENILGTFEQRKEPAPYVTGLVTDPDIGQTTYTGKDTPLDQRITLAPNLDNEDGELSKLLRKNKLQFDTQHRGTRPYMLLSTMDDLRKQLYANGLMLGCLRGTLDFTYIPPDQYVEARSVDDKIPAAEPAAPAAKKTKDPPAPPKGGAPKKPADPKKDAGAVQEETAKTEEDNAGWDRFLRTVKIENVIRKFLKSGKDELDVVIAEYYKGLGDREIERSGIPLRNKEADFRQWVEQRIGELEKRAVDYMTDGSREYRKTVMRVSLLCQRVPAELINALFNVSVDALTKNNGDAKATFDAFYISLMRKKRMHATLLKGSMASPNNRKELNRIHEEELQRIRRSMQLVSKFEGIVLREEFEESNRFIGRCHQAVQSLFTILKSTVSLDMLIAGEEIAVGKHKSLKRLVKQKQRIEAAKLLESKAAAAQKPEPKKGADAKKTDPKKAAGKDDPKAKKGAGGEKKEDDLDLPPFERMLQDFNGIPTSRMDSFARWVTENPTIHIMNHLLGGTTEYDTSQAVSVKKEVVPTTAKAAGGKDRGAAQNAQEEEPLTDTLTGLSDSVCQNTVLQRQQTFDAFLRHHQTTCASVRNFFSVLQEKEQAWTVSWNELVRNLQGGGGEGPPHGTPTPTGPTPTQAAPAGKGK